MQARQLRVAVAVVWMATGLGVLSPAYRAIGSEYLTRLHLGDVWMWIACVLEVSLAAFLVFTRPTEKDTLAQILAVSFFTVTLGVLEPRLLVHPYGVLTKNIPLVAGVVAARLITLERGEQATRVLRIGMATIWITEGLFPKILFQQSWERDIVAGSHLVPFDPGVFLILMGIAEIVSGVLLLVPVSRRIAQAVMGVQLAALVVLPILVTIQDPSVWVHPFGPMIKNVPIIMGTWVLMRRWVPRWS